MIHVMLRRGAITRAQVYGMRCSGTNYLDALLQKNFPGLKLGAVYYGVDHSFGWKHGDVGTPAKAPHNGALHDVPVTPLNWVSSKDTLLFVVYRNPLDWLQSLHRTPHQSPESFDMSFSNFIRHPWRAFHCPPGVEKLSRQARKQFIHEDNIIEEFPSLFAKRQSKIAIFESFKYRFQNVVYVNYEALLKDPERFLREMAAHYHLEMKKKFENVTTYKGGKEPFKASVYPRISAKDLLHIQQNLAWTAERAIGYTPHIAPRLFMQRPQFTHALQQFEIKGGPRFYHKGSLAYGNLASALS